MATSSTYDVVARFRVDTATAARGLNKLQSSLATIQGALGSTQSALGGMLTSMAGIAAGYLGFQAVSGAVRAATVDMIGFQAQLESTRIGLQSVLGAVEGTGFAGAADQANEAFNRLSMDALSSTATTAQLFGIYSNIVGPLRNAGTEMERIYDITNNTVAASSALNVDFEQAQRDIGAMLRGAAGVDVKLFSMLRSTGAIAQDTQKFNQLTAPERIRVLEQALGQFSSAADAYGGSFAGLSSSLTDFYQHFGSSFSAPIFEAMKTIMKSILDLFVVSDGVHTELSQLTRDVDNRLGLFGERVAAAMLRAFDMIRSAITYVSGNWDRILETAHTVASVLKAAFMGAAATSLAKALAGGALGGLGSLMGFLGTIGDIRAGMAVGAAGMTGLPMRDAATGRFMAGPELSTLGTAVSEVYAAFVPLLPVFAAVAVAVAGVGTLFATNGEQMMAIVGPMVAQLGGVWESIKSIGDSLWKILRPVLRLIGAIVVGTLTPVLSMLAAVLRVVADVVATVVEWLAEWAAKFEQYVVDPFVNFMLDLSRRIAELFGSGAEPNAFRRIRGDQVLETIEIVGSPDTPGDRARTVNDFRGSRISIEQTFKEADPDRVMVRLLDGLQRAAETRIQSGYAPALTRS